MSAPAQKPNPSLQKKSAARMAAVQCLYKQAMTGEQKPVDETVADLKKQLKDNRQEQRLLVGAPLEPDYAMLAKLLAGVSEHQDDIHVQIDSVLKDGWTRARMGPLLVGILTCGVFELTSGTGLNPRIVADEYTRLARHFFEADEVNFVHGVLARLGGAHG